MQRTPINPHPWTVKLGFDQAELIEGHRRMLVCSGQDSVDANGAPSIRATWPHNSNSLWTTWRPAWARPT
jgi:hypothetical protein